MRICTWNLNNILHRLPLLLAWLEATQPDVCVLQELKVENADFPRAALRGAGYGSAAVCQKTWNGVAVLAKGEDPIEIRRRLPGDEKDQEARFLEVAAHGVIVAGIYLPNGNPFPGPKFDRKMDWFERLLTHAEELWNTGHAVVLAGDFNVAPTDADIYASRSYADNALVQAGPREAYARLLGQGWTDALRAKHPSEPMYTFWDYRRHRWERDAGLRIDHVLLSKPLKRKLRAAGVDRAVRAQANPSDHAPVWVEL